MLNELPFAFSQFSVLIVNVKTIVGAFNQEKALVMVFSVIVKSSRRFVCSSIVQMSAGDHRPLTITDHCPSVTRTNGG